MARPNLDRRPEGRQSAAGAGAVPRVYDPSVESRERGAGSRPALARALLAWVAVALLALLAQAVLRPWLARERGGLGEARWLWAQGDPGQTAPIAFFLVREFTLPEPPAEARLIACGDEEFSLFVNGAWVSAGRYRPGAPADVRDLSPLLRPGVNRLVVELRSSHGLGGFAARIEDGAGRTLLATDRSWGVHRADWGLLGDGPLGPAERPHDWGPSPVGRWQRPPPGAVRAALDGPRAELRAPRFAGFPPGEWFAVPRRASRAHPLGRRVVFDWGEPVEGYLALEFASAEGGARTLVVLGEELPDEARPRADRLFVRPPGRNHWHDVEPRRFRYATVVSLEPVLQAKVYAEPAGPRREADPPGLFGIRQRALRPPGEDELWRELEGLPGGAGSEEGEGLTGLGGEAPR